MIKFNYQIDNVHYPNAVINVTDHGVYVDDKLLFKGTLTQDLIKRDDGFGDNAELSGFLAKSESLTPNKITKED